MRALLRFFCVLALVICPGSACAHSMYQSSVLIDVHASSLDLEVQLPPSRLGEALHLDITRNSLETLRPLLERYIDNRLHIFGMDGRRWSETQASPLTWREIDGAPYLVSEKSFQATSPKGTRQFILSDHVITDVLPSHSVLVSVRSDWAGNTFANEPDLVGVMNGEVADLPIDLGKGSWTRGFGSIFHLGIRHISEGTDHLLFLLALLLPAPLSYVWKRWSAPVSVRLSLTRILKIATAFTIGHSITLALASFGFVHVPERSIEALIAVSILISALHAIRPIFPGKESIVAASFGLVHGLAFATTLAELGLSGWERAESILAFNVGIETMQLVVILCVLPSLLLLSRTAAYTPFRLAGAAFASVASFGWIVERISRRTLGVDRGVNLLAAHALALTGALFLGSVLAFWCSGSQRERRGIR